MIPVINKHFDFSENLIKAMAQRLVDDGYLAAGYQYITIDDCWPEPERDKDGKLQPDHKRFPGGIKALADHVSQYFASPVCQYYTV